MSSRAFPAWAFLALASSALPAAAQDQEAPPTAAAEAVEPPLATPASAPFAAKAIDESELRAIAGREDIQQVSQADQNAEVTRNSVGDNSVTGDARIADNAFQNMSGLSILNVNTGNNVAINAAMNVNISIQPAP